MRFDVGYCQHAIGILVEALPRATEENIEVAIKNLESANMFGLDKLVNNPEEFSDKICDFDKFPERSEMLTSREEIPGLHCLMDICTVQSGMSIRWQRPVEFQCTCNIEKIWSMLRLLGPQEIKETIDENPNFVRVIFHLNICLSVQCTDFKNLFVLTLDDM